MSRDRQEPEVTLLGAQSSQLSAQVRGELDMQISTAKQYPRDPQQFISEATSWACADVDTAESCVYSRMVRDDHGDEVEIRGPSVRLAEIVQQAYMNLRVSSRLVSEAEKFVVVEAVAHDLERNTAQRAEVVVSIWGRNGRYGQQMIQTTILAAQAKARRNAVFAVVPGAWVRKIMLEVESVIGKQTKSLDVRVAAMVGFFGQRFKVSVERLLARLGRTSVAAITADDLVKTRTWAEEVEEGRSISEIFPVAQPSEAKPAAPAKPQAPDAAALQGVVDGAPRRQPDPFPPTQQAKTEDRDPKLTAALKQHEDAHASLPPAEPVKATRRRSTPPKAAQTPEQVTTPKSAPWSTCSAERVDAYIKELEDKAAAISPEVMAEAQRLVPEAINPLAEVDVLRNYCTALDQAIHIAEAAKA